MSHRAFASGDMVQLKSGGPPMTVNRVLGVSGGELVCVWFDGTEMKSGRFHHGAVERTGDDASEGRERP